MDLRLSEAGKPEGARAVDAKLSLEKGVVRLGAAGSEVVVPGAKGPLAEIAVEAGKATLKRTGDLRVVVGGKEVAAGAAVPLAAETLVTIGKLELVFKATGAPGAEPDAERPSLMAKDLLKQVFSALGVPEGEEPALVVYDAQDKLVKRLDLAAADTEVTIGRGAENRLVLYHASVSKSHARVVRDGLGFLVYDLESRNGLEVNGVPVKGKTRLKSGDRIRIGDFAIRFVDPKAATAALSDSMPDLARLEKAKPGERVEVGDRAAAAVEETASFQKKADGAVAKADPKGAPAKAAAGAPPAPATAAASGSGSGSREGSGSGSVSAVHLPASAESAPASGAGPLVYVLVGVGALVLVALLGLLGLIFFSPKH